MHTRRLGRTGLVVGEVGFGAWAIGGGYVLGGRGVGFGPTDDSVSMRAVERAIDLGVNLFDTAHAYGAGHSEELLGRVLGGRWEGRCVVSKVGNRRRDPLPSVKDFSRDYVLSACDECLRRLRKECLDVYLLHNPSLEVVRGTDIWETMALLRERGKVRFVGVSIGAPEEGVEIIQRDLADVVQVAYNILERRAEVELLPLARERDIGVMARVPLASGMLTGKLTASTTFDPSDHRSGWLTGETLARAVDVAERLKFLVGPNAKTLAEAALRFVLSNEAVGVVIPGAKTAQQVEANCAAGDGRGLPAALLQRLREVVPDDFHLRG